MPLIEVKDFNALIDKRQFFDVPIKSKQGAYEKPLEISRNDDYTTETLIDFSQHQNYYKLIGIDLLRQRNTSILQQINLMRKIEEDYGVTIFFIAEKQQKAILKFSLDSLNVTE